jgi:hypothetical protein
LIPKHEFELDVKLDVDARVRQGVKGVLEEVLAEVRKEHGSYVRPQFLEQAAPRGNA